MSVSLVIPVLTFAVLAVLLWVVHQTRTGMAMRAVSTDLDAARLQAIDVNRIIAFTFGTGSLLAGGRRASCGPTSTRSSTRSWASCPG